MIAVVAMVDEDDDVSCRLCSLANYLICSEEHKKSRFVFDFDKGGEQLETEPRIIRTIWSGINEALIKKI